jgi:MSHA biogenesis protein MshL
VRVFPRRPSTRLFEVSHLDVRRGWQRRTAAYSSTDGGRAAADLTSAAGGDFFGALEAGVRALLSESGRLHVDRHAGIVQVTDFADRLDQAALYVETATLRASRQVRIEARVLEVRLAGTAAVDWKVVAAQAGAPSRADSTAGLRVTDFDGLLRAIAGFGPVRTLAASRILAMNNEPAVMRVGSDGAVFESAGEGRTGADRAAAGDLTLTIVPQIGSDGIVHMIVSPSLAEHGTVRGPSAIVEADSVMRVRGGDTVVIAGLIRERGAADRSELVILITPTVVSAGESPAEGAR